MFSYNKNCKRNQILVLLQQNDEIELEFKTNVLPINDTYVYSFAFYFKIIPGE